MSLLIKKKAFVKMEVQKWKHVGEEKKEQVFVLISCSFRLGYERTTLFHILLTHTKENRNIQPSRVVSS